MTDHRHTGPLYDVRAPDPNEGIGRALRGAYAEPVRSLPSDIAGVLDRLR